MWKLGLATSPEPASPVDFDLVQIDLWECVFSILTLTMKPTPLSVSDGVIILKVTKGVTQDFNSRLLAADENNWGGGRKLT